VIEGLGWLHHPRRNGASARFVRPSLEMLIEIQKTGDIFFPQRWMGVTLGSYHSPEVAAEVRQFLKRPNYPERLRKTILVMADELFHPFL
jgi:aminopeptidase N